MAFSYGFYDSYKGDRKYVSSQISRIFDGIINDGVYATVGDSLVLKPSTVQNTVIVGTGRAWFDHTWNYNDADLPIECPPSEILLDRIDAIVLDVNGAINERTNAIICVQGTPSTNPQPPSLISETEHHQYPLGYVRRNANDTIIEQGKITNTVGTDACPFVTGLLQVVSIEALLLQWKAQWEEWYKKYTEEYAGDFTTWSEQQQRDMELWQKKYQDNNDYWAENEKADMEAWEAAFQKDYTDWLAGIKGTLTEDAATNLYNITDELKHEKNKVKWVYGGDNDDTNFPNGYYKICSATLQDAAKSKGIYLRIYSPNYNNYRVKMFEGWFYIVSGNGSSTLPRFFIDCDPLYRYTFLASRLFVKMKNTTDLPVVFELYFRKMASHNKIYVEVLSENYRLLSINDYFYSVTDHFTMYPNGRIVNNIEETGYTCFDIYNSIYAQRTEDRLTNWPVVSPTVECMQLVTSLPADAADHPEIIYVVVESLPAALMMDDQNEDFLIGEDDDPYSPYYEELPGEE